MKHEDYAEDSLMSTNMGDFEAENRITRMGKRVDRFSYSCFIRRLCVYFRLKENILLVGISTRVSGPVYLESKRSRI